MDAQTRDNYLKIGVVAVVLVLLISNLWLVVKVKSIQERVDTLPTSISGGNTYVDLSRLYTGVDMLEYRIISEDMAETIEVAFDFKLTEKLPGTQVFLQYRESDAVPWTRVRAGLVTGLEYRAVAQLDPAVSYSYQVVQVAGGETLRETRASSLELTHLIGSPDLRISLWPVPWNSSQTVVGVGQNTQIKAWQVEKVTIELDNSFGQETHLLDPRYSGISGQSIYENKLIEKTKAITITAYYRDGTSRSVTFDPQKEREVTIRKEP